MKMIPWLLLALLLTGPAAAQEEIDFTTGGGDEPEAASPDAILGEASAQHELARTYKAIGRTPPDELKAMFEGAIEAYERFAEEFPSDARAATARLAKARAQRDMGDDAAALVTCSKLRDQEPAVKERAEAALCAVYTSKALLEAVQAQGASKRPSPAALQEAAERGRTVPMPEPVAKHLEALGFLARDAEGLDVDPELRARAVYLLADLLGAYGRGQEAAPLYEKVFTWRPALDVAEASAEELMAGPRARGDWPTYLAVVDRLAKAELATPQATESFRARLQQNRSAAGFAQVMKHLEAERWDEAEKELAALVAANPKHPDAAKALFNRGFALEKLGRPDDALACYRGVFEGYPTSELVPRALILGGRIARDKRLIDDAVAWWVRVAKAYPKEPDAPAALLGAADLLLQDNRIAEAVELVDLHVKLYAEQRPALLARAGDLFAAIGKSKEALARYERFLKEAADAAAAERVRVAFQAGLQAERLKKGAAAKKHFAAAARLADEAGVAGEWADRARAKAGGALR